MAGRFELKRNADDQFVFNLKTENDQIILQSEPYLGRLGARSGIELVKSSAASDSSYERRLSRKNEPYFVLKMANGQIIGTSKVYPSISAMDNEIASVRTSAPDAAVEDLTIQKKPRKRRKKGE
jgi:uncharacterized protein YegP (UPF0339 family)